MLKNIFGPHLTLHFS